MESKLTIKLPTNDKEALVKLAKQQDLTPSQVLRKLIRDWLKQQKERGNGQTN